MMNTLRQKADEAANLLLDTVEEEGRNIIRATEYIWESLSKGGKVYIIGNGGSAADAQHFAAELSGRFKLDRPALPVLSLTTDTSALTAIANDYGYEQVFERQVAGIVQKGDTLIALSTSGKSKNILLAIDKALVNGARVVGLTGDRCEFFPGNVHIKVPSKDTPRIQETHMFILHQIAETIEQLAVNT